jgi:hypothetical protein
MQTKELKRGNTNHVEIGFNVNHHCETSCNLKVKYHRGFGVLTVQDYIIIPVKSRYIPILNHSIIFVSWFFFQNVYMEKVILA